MSVYKFVEELSATYLEAMGRMEEILRSGSVVDRPAIGQIYLHRGTEVEVLAAHGVFVWVVEANQAAEDSYHTPYTIHPDHLEKASFKVGDLVQMSGKRGDRRVHTVIAVVDRMVWHRAGPGQDFIDPDTNLRRAT